MGRSLIFCVWLRVAALSLLDCGGPESLLPTLAREASPGTLCLPAQLPAYVFPESAPCPWRWPPQTAQGGIHCSWRDSSTVPLSSALPRLVVSCVQGCLFGQLGKSAARRRAPSSSQHPSSRVGLVHPGAQNVVESMNKQIGKRTKKGRLWGRRQRRETRCIGGGGGSQLSRGPFLCVWSRFA